MPSSRELSGILVPVCTPFTTDYGVDEPSLERLIDFLLDAGVHGLFLLGTSSETHALTDRQRAQVIEVGLRAVNGRVPVIVGVFDMATAAAIEHARVAEGAGADAVVLTAPFYAAGSPAEIARHFELVRDAIAVPIMAYDIPSTVHCKLDKATVLSLARDGVIMGIKDSSGEEGNFRALVHESRDIPGFVTFTGSERTADLALGYGATGIVPGLGNVDPAGFVRLYEAARAGEWDQVRCEQERLLRLFPLIATGDLTRMGFFSSIFGSFKTALMLRGVIETNVVGRPLAQFNDADVARVRDVLAGVDF